MPAARGVGGTRGRALTALALTLRDVGEDALTRFILDQRDPDLARGGGLRGGRYRIDGRNGLHLDDVVFVPGVRVSGFVRRFAAPRQSGRLRLGGRVDGVALSARPPGERAVGRRAVRAVLSARALPPGCGRPRRACRGLRALSPVKNVAIISPKRVSGTASGSSSRSSAIPFAIAKAIAAI